MSNDEPEDGRCNARTRDGTDDDPRYCANWPVRGAERCRMHGGVTAKSDDCGAPEGNTNAETHGLRADPFKLYERLDADARKRVDEWTHDLLADVARAQGFGDDADDCPPYLEPEARRVAVNLWRVTEAYEAWEVECIDEADVVNPLVDRRFSHFDVNGNTVYDLAEAAPARVARSLSEENRRWLRDMGLLDGPDDDGGERSQATSVAQAAERFGGTTDGSNGIGG